ncbi:MAG: glycosyltransferase family 4 protein, partial [Proteobacteria bacterium]|nr:glycosyltransferase family 4 protein [Pseudomonadota bacterium]
LPPRRLDHDGVPHHFAPTRAKLRYARALEAYHREAADALEAQCRALRPTVIHAASNYNVGLAAVEVGRRLGVPVIYEVRGLWHVSKTVASPHYAGSDHYRLIERLEAQAATAADHTFAITSGVADVLSAAGVPANKLSLLGNAADVTAFTPQPPDPARVAALGLAGKVVVGYVGSLRRYEGLDDLLVAVAALPDTLRAQLAVLIVGDGEQRGPLTEQAAALGLSGLVTFTGRIPAAEAPSYYAILDLLVLPRIPTLVCELVSPIKSFEAMAMGKPVLASDVAALSDIITDGVTGRLFRKGDRADLSRILAELVGDRPQRERLGQTAAAWVRRARTWDVLASEVEAVYLRLTNAYATGRHARW